MGLWHIKGGAEYEDDDNPDVWCYIDINGFDENNYDSITISDIEDDDPFFYFHNNGSLASPDPQFELGLYNTYRIRFSNTDVEIYDVDSSTWKSLVSVVNDGLTAVVDDETPQLGGALDTNGKAINDDSGDDIVTIDDDLDVQGDITVTGTVDGVDIATHVGDDDAHHDVYEQADADADIATHAADDDAHHTKYTDAEVEAVINTELGAGQSIDNAIDSLITTHAGDDNAHHEVFENLVEDTTPQLGGDLDLLSHEIDSDDDDTVHEFGRAALGFSGFNDYAAFGHRDGMGLNTYALLQSSLGETLINSASGLKIFFKINHVTIMDMSASGLRLGSGARITEVENNDSLGTSDTKLCTQGNVKAYVDAATGGGAVLNHDHYIHLQDQKSQNTHGGTFTSGDDGGVWGYQRDITDIVEDTGSHCSLSSNRFTLDAGTYKLIARAATYAVGHHQLGLYNYSDSSFEFKGETCYSHPSNGGSITAEMKGTFTIASSKTLEIRHKCSDTRATNGFGLAGNLDTEIYCDVEIFKVG